MPDPARLHEPYATALDLAVAYLTGRFSPLAIVASGSVVRGTGHATSDLDLVVVHEPAWRQRVQRWFNGVACEMFVNPAFQIRRQMSMDAREGRPVMANMLATGVIVRDTEGLAAKLQDEARANLAAGPQLDPAALAYRRYGIATIFEDAMDIAAIDGDRCRALLVQCLVDGAKWWPLANGRWLPRDKELFADLDRHDPNLGALVRATIRETDLERQLTMAEVAMRQLIGTTGFHEWESDPEPLTE